MSKRLGIIGCGQLGLMLGSAASKLGLKVCFLNVNEESVVYGIGQMFYEAELETFLSHVDYVTVEREAIPEYILQRAASTKKLYPSFDALNTLRQRHSQKALFDRLNIPTAPWAYVEQQQALQQVVQDFPSTRIRAKSVLGGYDGGGQWSLSETKPGTEIPAAAFPLILEAEMVIDFEISVLMARAHDGSTQRYPLNHNVMRDGVLICSYVPANVDESMAQLATRYAEQLMDAIDYVGVLAMEFFVQDGKLFVNEIAPRVHNTGHWTIEGCRCDQFEQHVRAVTEMPLVDPQPVGAAAMCNILGDWFPKKLPNEPVRVYLHGYGKTLRPGRKMGHLTLIGSDLDGVVRAVSELGLD